MEGNFYPPKGNETNIIQAYLRDIAVSVLDHHNKMSHSIFAGGGSCLQFVKHTTFEKHNKAKGNKMPVYPLPNGKKTSSLFHLKL